MRTLANMLRRLADRIDPPSCIDPTTEACLRDGLITMNEARVLEGLPSVDPQGVMPIQQKERAKRPEPIWSVPPQALGPVAVSKSPGWNSLPQPCAPGSRRTEVSQSPPNSRQDQSSSPARGE